LRHLPLGPLRDRAPAPRRGPGDEPVRALAGRRHQAAHREDARVSTIGSLPPVRPLRPASFAATTLDGPPPPPGGTREALLPTRSEQLRKLRSRFFTGLCALSAAVVLAPLLSIILYIASRGLPGLSLSFFTGLPKPVGEEGGGMGNAVLGS